MVPTVAANMEKRAKEISELLETLLLKHSSIYHWNMPDDQVIFISLEGDYAYNALSDEGRQIQARLLKQYQRYYAMLSVLFRDHPKDTQTQMEQTNKVLLRTIEQGHTWSKTTDAALKEAYKYLQIQTELLNRLYAVNTDKIIYVPDTNALIFNPEIETWQFNDSPQFTIILLTTVISELDKLKVNHRNEAVREKAEKLIRKLKEYRRRGALTEGVTVVNNKIQLQAMAVEVDMNTSLPWLDAGNEDDRILAGVLEVMREYPHSSVIAVSRDLNFQNKAEFASIPFVEPPAV